MRHAKSSWKDSSLRDHDRPLNPRGRRVAREMAVFLQQRLPLLDCVLSSTAVRASLTAQVMADQFGIPEIQLRPSLYEADSASWKTFLGQIPASKTTLVIGHNPAMEELVCELAGESVRFPTAAVAVCAVLAGSPTFSCSQLRLLAIWRPREVLAS